MTQNREKLSSSLALLSRPKTRRVLVHLLRLILLSAIVGLVLSIMGIQLLDVAVHTIRFLRSVGDMGLGMISATFSIILLGAVIVLPLSAIYWAINRLTGTE